MRKVWNEKKMEYSDREMVKAISVAIFMGVPPSDPDAVADWLLNKVPEKRKKMRRAKEKEWERITEVWEKMIMEKERAGDCLSKGERDYWSF